MTSRQAVVILAGGLVLSGGVPWQAWATDEPTGVDSGYGTCALHGNYKGASCPGCAASSSGNTNTGTEAPSRAEKARLKRMQEEQAARERRKAEALDANERGVAACNARQWAKAVALFREAVEKNPESPVMRQNLAFAQAELEKAQAVARDEREKKDSLAGMRDAVRAFSQTSGQIDFDGGELGFIASPPSSSAVAATGTLQFGDPMVVDGRSVPSGLPKAIDDAIADVYGKSPPGVRDAVRKGFQALTAHDWKTANAWFGDALRRDPSNPGLQRLVAIAGEPSPAQRPPMKEHTRDEWKKFLQLPDESDPEFLFTVRDSRWLKRPDGTFVQVPLDADIPLIIVPEKP